MSKEYYRLLGLRKRLFLMIAAQLKEDPCCKSYEGALEVSCEYPCYFDDSEAEHRPSYYCITVHCYVLGPARHYEFTGRSLNDALDKFEKALNEWEEEMEDS